MSTFSAGSAAFSIIALALACISQPPGSLIFSGSHRMWRLNPFYALYEAIIIYTHLVRWRYKQNVPFHVSARALLVERFGSCRQFVFCQLRQQRPSGSDVYDTRHAARHDRQSIPRGALDNMLDEVENLERGVSIRISIVVPVLLQFAKLLIIKRIPLTIFLGMMYFSSWLFVELLLLLIHGKSLQYEETHWEFAKHLVLASTHTEESELAGCFDGFDVLYDARAPWATEANEEPHGAVLLHSRQTPEPGWDGFNLSSGVPTWPSRRLRPYFTRGMDVAVLVCLLLLIWQHGTFSFTSQLFAFVAYVLGGSGKVHYAVASTWGMKLVSRRPGQETRGPTPYRVPSRTHLTTGVAALRAFVVVVVHYAVAYRAEGSVKPNSLDWLG